MKSENSQQINNEIVEELYKLRKVGILGSAWEIKNKSKFIQSNLFKHSTGLGYTRDLTSTLNNRLMQTHHIRLSNERM